MNKAKLLLIDDEAELRELVKDSLNLHGFINVNTASNTKEARKIMRSLDPDLILLDIMMPNESGIEFLKDLRSFSDIPVILLTAKGESKDIISGLESGADDYIVKPFMTRELILRIEAILKRTMKDNSKIIYLSDASIDLNKAQVTKSNGSIYNLTAKEFTILKKLYENAGNIVSVNSLCEDIVGNIFSGYENTLMSHIRHIREKIELNPSHPKSLITVKGLGYKLELRS